MATVTGNRKIAANRGAEWRSKLVGGKLDSVLHPTHLKLKRAQKLISQDQLANELGVSLSTYGAIERGRRAITKETASKLCSILSASISSLFQPGQQGKYVASRVK